MSSCILTDWVAYDVLIGGCTWCANDGHGMAVQMSAFGYSTFKAKAQFSEGTTFQNVRVELGWSPDPY